MDETNQTTNQGVADMVNNAEQNNAQNQTPNTISKPTPSETQNLDVNAFIDEE